MFEYYYVSIWCYFYLPNPILKLIYMYKYNSCLFFTLNISIVLFIIHLVRNGALCEYSMEVHGPSSEKFTSDCVMITS